MDVIVGILLFIIIIVLIVMVILFVIGIKTVNKYASTIFSAERANTSNIVVVNNTVTDVPFNNVKINNGYTYDGNVLIIPYNGYYRINSQIMMAQPATQPGRREILLNVNDAIYHGSVAPGTSNEFVTPNCDIILQLKAGDKVKIQTFQDGGNLSSVQIIANDEVDKFNWFNVELLELY